MRTRAIGRSQCQQPDKVQNCLLWLYGARGGPRWTTAAGPDTAWMRGRDARTHPSGLKKGGTALRRSPTGTSVGSGREMAHSERRERLAMRQKGHVRQPQSPEQDSPPFQPCGKECRCDAGPFRRVTRENASVLRSQSAACRPTHVDGLGARDLVAKSFLDQAVVRFEENHSIP